jgi:thiol-disulfide isomerase/thioredoxin
MKKHIIFLILFLAISNFILAQTSHYKVTLWIHQIEDSTLYVHGSYGEKENILLDSLQIQPDGSFILEGDFQQGIVVLSNRHQQFFSFLLDKNPVFTIDMYPYGYFEVKGCKENELYLEYQKRNRESKQLTRQYEKEIKEFPQQKDSLSYLIKTTKAKFNQYQNEFFKNNPNNLMTSLLLSMQNPKPNPMFFEKGKLIKGKELDYAYDCRIRFWDNFNFQDQRILSTPYFYKKFKTYIEKITMQSADSVYVALEDFINAANQRGGQIYSQYIINLYLAKLPLMPFSFNEHIYLQIVENLINKGKTPWLSLSDIETHNINTQAIKPFLPGNKFPNINSLYDLEAKYTIIHFYSSTCESCKKDIDDLINFYNDDSKTYDAQIISINVGEETSESPFAWTNWQIDPQILKQKHSIDIIRTPEVYILDKDKTILNKTVIYSHIKKAIKDWEGF